MKIEKIMTLESSPVTRKMVKYLLWTIEERRKPLELLEPGKVYLVLYDTKWSERKVEQLVFVKRHRRTWHFHELGNPKRRRIFTIGYILMIEEDEKQNDPVAQSR